MTLREVLEKVLLHVRNGLWQIQRQSNRQTDRWTYRWLDGQTRQTERQTKLHMSSEVQYYKTDYICSISEGNSGTAETKELYVCAKVDITRTSPRIGVLSSNRTLLAKIVH